MGEPGGEARELARIAKRLKDFCDGRTGDLACMSCPWRENCAVEPYVFVTDPGELVGEDGPVLEEV